MKDKTYKNFVFILMNESKQIYYTKYFQSNWNNIGNTWKEIKATISVKNITTTVLHSTELINQTITDPTAMRNIFNNSLTSVADKTKSAIKSSPKLLNTGNLFNRNITGTQKIWILQHLLIPRTQWPLLIYEIPISLALKLEQKVSVFI